MRDHKGLLKVDSVKNNESEQIEDKALLNDNNL